MDEDKYRYVFLPLSILQRIYTHPDTAMLDLVYMGIGLYARQIRITKRQALSYILDVNTYAEKVEFSEDIDGMLCRADEDLDIFNLYDENPGEAVKELLNYFDRHFPETEGALIWFCQLLKAKDKLDITFSNRLFLFYFKKIESYCIKGDPMISVKLDLLFEFQKQPKKKYEIDMLACYLGIRSIIGKKPFIYTTK